MKQRIDTWKRMVATGDPAAANYLQKITEQATAEGKIDEMSEAIDTLMNDARERLDGVERSIAACTMHERLGSLTEAINLAYIARRYFGKSRQWLYQRLKGQIVNGKPAAFTADEEAAFKAALAEIGSQIIDFARKE